MDQDSVFSANWIFNVTSYASPSLLRFHRPHGGFSWLLVRFLAHIKYFYSSWRCWLSGRKGIRPVKKRVVVYWHDYLSEARCKWFAYGPADATATHISCFIKIQISLTFLVPAYLGCRGKEAIKRVSVCHITHMYVHTSAHIAHTHTQHMIMLKINSKEDE